VDVGVPAIRELKQKVVKVLSACDDLGVDTEQDVVLANLALQLAFKARVVTGMPGMPGLPESRHAYGT